MPHFQEVYEAHAGQFEIVAINLNAGRQDPAGFWNSKGYSFPAALDDGSAAEMFKVGGIPHTVFYDSNGNKVDEVVGGMEKAEFEAKLQGIL